MSANLKQQLDKLSDENFEKILSPLNSLIKGLANKIEGDTYTGLENQKKEDYEYYIQNTLLSKLKESLENDDININNEIIILIHYYQNHLISSAYNKATDINDFYEKLTLLPEQLKDKENLKKLYTSDK